MIVIKVGGSVVNGLDLSALEDIKSIAQNDKLIFVHGGGKEVTEIATKLGKEQKFIISPGGVRSR
jgi:acetylglutamate/LysW-gamma-L-alpha-aminoadipate kinase